MSTDAPAPAPTVKQANKPFLKHKKWKEQQAAAASSPSPASSSSPLSLSNALKWLCIALVVNFLMSRAITETWLWQYEVLSLAQKALKHPLFSSRAQGKWLQLRSYLPVRLLLLL